MSHDRSLLAAVLLVAVAAAVIGAVIGEFPDLHVYRYGGRSVLDQVPGYESDDPVTGYPLTYPPFAALAMVPLALLPGWLAAGLWTALSAGCLAGAVVLVRREHDQQVAGWLVLAVAAGSPALEPVWQNYSFGQINLILMLAILVDLVFPERRWSGLLLGIAAGIKLTPLVFVVLLVLVGHRHTAVRASLSFAATVAIGLVAMPGASSYWTDGLVDPKRVGPPQLAHNQSLAGALTRMLGEPPPTVLWLAVAGPVALAIIAVAAAWWRRGDRVLGACLGAMAMLVASPVSWSHHWVWAVPVALVLWERLRWAAAGWTAVFVARPMLWPPWGDRREFDWRWFEHVYGNAYLLAALALGSGAAVAIAKMGTEPSAMQDRMQS
ncbi:glycosyltransferase 87 family protein [Nocardioides speluncae]|uniref:glycosyltransferase 87 family protein n=1 Tax=Nocardioides speluncae TaxID=2670337 RepID=UPI000D68B7F4|nr:glycosyltransferase 87 family protein [Nocardioides speluncae]